MANGEKLYAARCLRCHGVAGKGDGPKAASLQKKPADYTDKKKMAEFTDDKLKDDVRDGGSSMPSYRGKMSEKELDDVIAYIRTFAAK